MDTPNPYPVIQFLVKQGQRCAIALTAMVVLLGAVLAWQQASWLIAVGGVAAAAVTYVLARSYVELVHVIADMLLPK